MVAKQIAKSLSAVLACTVLSLAFTVIVAEESKAQTHNYLNTMRSSAFSHVFVSQSVEGEYGKYQVTGLMPEAEGVYTDYEASQFWKGYGIGSTIGLEVLKFIQFSINHTFVNMANADDGLETLRGSRLHAGTRLVFLAPIGNLEVGGGVLGSRLDYQNKLETSSFYGSGYYYSLGVNYFMSPRFSLFASAKMAREHLGRNGGSALVKSMDTGTTLMGIGFRIWM